MLKYNPISTKIHFSNVKKIIMKKNGKRFF